MRQDNNVIFLQGKPGDRSGDIEKLEQLPQRKLCVYFYDGGSYTYNRSNVEWYTKPKLIDLSAYYVYHGEKLLNNYRHVYYFNDKYYKFEFVNGRFATYEKSELIFKVNCNQVRDVKALLEYLKKVVLAIGENDFLREQLEAIDVKEDSVLYKYATAAIPQTTKDSEGYIFPFRSNNSQREAIENAFNYDMSLIQGPPGTGKSETILNITANAIMRGKTVAVVSNNNSATKNIQEKLEKQGYGFLTAFLGNKQNLDAFFKNQTSIPKEIKKWKLSDADLKRHRDAIAEGLNTLKAARQYKERKVELQKCVEELKTEQAISDAEYRLRQKNVSEELTGLHFTTRQILSMKASLELLPEKKFKNFFSKMRFLFRYGIFDLPKFFPNKNDALDYLDAAYYSVKLSELHAEHARVEKYLKSHDIEKIENAILGSSELLFKHCVFETVGNYEGIRFDRKYFRENFSAFSKRYPIMLNTTQSLLSSTGRDKLYDYVIIDESSQVSLTAAAVAFSIAKNAIIVGDSMQLPHIVKTSQRAELDEIFRDSKLNKAYSYVENSVLESFKRLYKSAIKSAFLREHYRCDPQIIEFCNKRFYNNKLLVTTKRGNGNAVEILRSATHSEFKRTNERQVCEISEIVLPNLKYKEIGIIAPYHNQVELLKERLKRDDIKIETVHSF